MKKPLISFRERWVINREVKSRTGEARTLGTMGQVRVCQGEYDKAIEYFAPALGIHQEVKDRRSQATGFCIANPH